MYSRERNGAYFLVWNLNALICAGGFIGTPALRKSSEGSEDSRSDSEARRDVASRAEAKMNEVEQRKLYCASSASDADGYRSAWERGSHNAGVLDSKQTSCFLFMLSRDESSLHRKCEFCCEVRLWMSDKCPIKYFLRRIRCQSKKCRQ